MPVRIKICGITNNANLQSIYMLNPDYVGFIFYPYSKRYVGNPQQVAAQPMQPIQRVGVFVNPTLQEVSQKILDYKLDVIQLHGHESPEFCSKINKIRPVIKAFQINKNFNFNSLNTYKSACNMFLFDTSTKLYGGSGKKFDWKLLQKYMLPKPFMLSGGIAPNDIHALKKLEHPQLKALDLNSQFELSPGIKNIDLLASFLNQLRYATP